jgi:hypothetical protein
MTRQQLQERLSAHAGEYVYTYERLSNGSSEYLVYPYERGCEIEGAAILYRFNDKGERIK